MLISTVYVFPLIGLYEPSDVVIIRLLLTRAENRQRVVHMCIVFLLCTSAFIANKRVHYFRV